MSEPRMGACKFEHIVMADEIGSRVGGRIFQRITHTGLGGEMQDQIIAFPARSGGQRTGRRNIGADETEAGIFLQFGQTCFLETRIVIGVNLIHRGDAMAAAQKRHGRVKTDEARAAGEKDVHFVAKPLKRWRSPAQYAMKGALSTPPPRNPVSGKPHVSAQARS